MRVFGLAVALGVLALSGYALPSSAGSPTSPANSSQAIEGVWRGIITGRELNTGSGASADTLTLVVAADGTWTATRGSERWKGTVRPVGNGFEFDGTTSAGGRPVSFMLHRYGRDGLGGAVVTDTQGRRTSLTADLRAVPTAGSTAGGSDSSEGSASPPSAPAPSNFGRTPGQYPEMGTQAP